MYEILTVIALGIAAIWGLAAATVVLIGTSIMLFELAASFGYDRLINWILPPLPPVARPKVEKPEHEFSLKEITQAKDFIDQCRK